MDITKQNINDVLLITIEDKDANLSKSEHFKEQVLNEITLGARKLIVSFERVEYIDSSFLGAMVAILKNLLPQDGKLVLIELNSDINNLFELTRLDKIFDLKDSLETALKEF
ncbi:STAS domain-containing protein [Pedobacter metabolipauper]|uniref:Anti-sigma factor antagonist n=1 Tax=Pedobacter metabolipauper TaxID=425513 RepID=A0A4R6T3P7_9SPHI|nr:STAS domain-containing protein [Pedobacter metabolipauper]TDQ11991.1 anti-sigma B factor antagonist [Pedobacter metabolipauper]